MNREILFKAKHKDWRELPKEEWWVEGYYLRISPDDVVFVPFNASRGTKWGWIEIDPKTLCQYTGLTDKNGKRIWENDIVRCGDGTVLRVSWHTFKASWVLSKKGWMYNHFFGEGVEPEDVEVIGNIFDTPELLKED